MVPNFPITDTHTHRPEAVLSLVLEAASPGRFPLCIPGVFWQLDRRKCQDDCPPPKGHGECVCAFVGMLGISVQHQDMNAFLLRAALERAGMVEGGHLQGPGFHPGSPPRYSPSLKRSLLVPGAMVGHLPHPVGLRAHFLPGELGPQLLMEGRVWCVGKVTGIGSGHWDS